MNIEKLEDILREIREREDFLIQLKKKDSILSVVYHSGISSEMRLFDLSKEEVAILKSSSLTRIKQLKGSIKTEIE